MDFLPDVAAGKISNISRALKLSTVQVRKYIEQISHLNPKPLTGFSKERTSFVVSDIIFHEENGEWDIEQNDNWINDYMINDYYLKMMSESKDQELKAYFRMKLERVRFIMNSIEQRRQTILSIAQAILERQMNYFEGKGVIQPMTMMQIAEIIGVHPSTVSRAIKGKYIQCPRGSVSMKDLFTSAVSKEEGDFGISASYVKMRIKELVEKEDKRKPYSDQSLTLLLEKMNISISRRAVAKYREEVGIKGSFDRKVS
jgi:RNA polymerase sigma-54 factor